MLLAGDIGGTKTVLALYHPSDESLKDPIREEIFPSRNYSDFGPLLEKFLDQGPRPKIHAACIGVAGPVIMGRCQTTNLPWVLDERDLAEELGTSSIRLFNDVEAAAYGMTFLRDDELCTLTSPSVKSRPGHAVLLAAGTGLGQATLCWDGQHYHPMASEGGHADFAPQTDHEVELYKYLRKKFGHVSYERVLSGPGFVNIYAFLRDSGFAEEPLWLKDRIQLGDPAAVITTVGLAGDHSLCTETLSMFVRIYGAAAGNLALNAFALGGVFIGGGIAPKILKKLQDGTFLQAFLQKGRYETFLRTLRVRVALNPRAPLIGAARYAGRLAQVGSAPLS
jgi:glucokinase